MDRSVIVKAFDVVEKFGFGDVVAVALEFARDVGL